MEQKNCNTFSKVTAVLCALVILFGVIAFFGGSTTDRIERLDNQIKYQKEQLLQQEESIAQREVDIAGYQQEKQTAEANLTKAEEEEKSAAAAVQETQNAVDQANANLDTVCTRSYYSSWYCTEACQGLHTEVSNKQTALSAAKSEATAKTKQVTSAENAIKKIDNNIEDAEADIANAEERIDLIEEQIKELRGELTGAWFMVIFKVIAMILAVGGLGLLAKNFYTGTQDKFTLYAVAGLGGSALLFWIANAINNVVFEKAFLLYLLLNPHTWTVVVMALFAVILLEKTQKPVAMRNTAVVFSVLIALTSVLNRSFAGLLFGAAMICAAFVIVPLVFTKYIDIAKHIFLSLITFGIWLLVWTYHVTKNLNEVEGVDERKPARELLLFLFLPFYYPYWLYKTAEGVEDYGMENGKEFKIDVLCIAFAFVCPLFATVLIQNKINVVAGKPVPAEPEVVEEPAEEAPVAEEEPAAEEAEAVAAE